MFGRFCSAWIFALIMALGGAVLEAGWANGVATEPLNFVRASVVAFALIAPVAFVIALIGAVVAPVLWFIGPSPEAERPSRREPGASGLSTLPLLALAAPVLMVLVAYSALGGLSMDLPPALVAPCLALATLALTRPLLGAVLALTARAGVTSTLARLPRAAVIALALVFFLVPIGWGIASGTANGEGGFWAILGVLGRQELDLRAVGLLAVLATAAMVGARFSRAGLVPLILATSVALVATLATALRLLDDTALSLALERGAALSRTSLRTLRAVTDRDGDGISAYFGSHDCDDTRDDIYPGARDIGENGIDEDCSGMDAAAVTPPPSTEGPVVAPTGAANARVPADLNVILITVDTLRYDLGYTGYGRPISTNLDQLAARAVVFDRAYALASYTGKSMGPLLIGKYPSETRRGWLHFNRFGTDETFLQERLQAAKIRTLSVQGHWYFTPAYGLGRGFDVLDMTAAPAKRQLEGDKTVNSDKLSDAAISQLSRPENTQSRFFMWVHYLDPHAEYIRHPQFEFGSRGRDLYDSEVAFTDREVGRLLDFVRASEFGGRTAIIVTSDHGEAFGEHGMYRHGFELWEALVRVPLIVYVPGVDARRHSVRRGAIDLAPTLLELFELPLPTGEDRLSGQSLVSDIVMPSGYVPEPRPIFIDMSAGPYNEERQALIEDDIKLIMSSGRSIGLYDLGKDPTESQDRTSDSELLKRARDQFVAFHSQLRLVRVKPD